MDIFGGIIGLILILCGVTMLCWLCYYSVRNETVKRNRELESEIKQLKIVNENLAKYNKTLLDNLKK